MRKINNGIWFGLGAIAFGFGARYLDEETASNLLSDSQNWWLLILGLAILVSYIGVWRAMTAIKRYVLQRDGLLDEALEEAQEQQENWWSRLVARLQDSRPVEEEEEIEMDHNYDGIRELDNNLPPWWLYGFYITIIFSVIYLLRYHVFQTAPDQIEEYRMEMARAEEAREEYLAKAGDQMDENSVTLITEGPRLEAGAAIYKANCAVCHAQDGGGGVGPNLTDEYWINGGSINDVFATVKYGVPSKGMVPWQDQLNPKQMQEVASFVLSLQGTEPADPKDPQGELYVPEKEDTEEASGQDTTAEDV